MRLKLEEVGGSRACDKMRNRRGRIMRGKVRERRNVSTSWLIKLQKSGKRKLRRDKMNGLEANEKVH